MKPQKKQRQPRAEKLVKAKDVIGKPPKVTLPNGKPIAMFAKPGRRTKYSSKPVPEVTVPLKPPERPAAPVKHVPIDSVVVDLTPPAPKKRSPFARKVEPGGVVLKRMQKRKRKPGEQGVTDFVDNAVLLSEVIKSKRRLAENPELGNAAMTRQLSDMLLLLVTQYSTKGNWTNYSYKDEFVGDAILHLFKKWHKFDETKYNNPFAFFTQIIYRCFLTTLGREKKQQKIKDSLLESMGMSPSNSRMLEHQRQEAERIAADIGSGPRDSQERADIGVEVVERDE